MTNAGTLTVTTPTDTEIVLTRIFDAPRRLVFDAWTKPELLVRWYGRHGWNLVVCEVDLRVGGAWRFVSRGPGGAEMTSRGVYREIVVPERLVSTESYDDFASESVVTMTLVEVDGTTTLTSTVRYPSREVRDAVLKTPMQEGAGEGFDRLAEMLESLRIAERYRRLAGRFGELIVMVPASSWSNPSPCEGWDARDVVRHNVEMARFMLGLNGRTLPDDAPSVDDDPLGAWNAARSTVQAALDDPTVAVRLHEEHVHLGRGPWNVAVDRVLSSDLVIHNWDLARSIGRDERIDPDDFRGWEEAFAGIPEEALRQPEVFGPTLDPPPGADEQTRFLAFLGRKAW